MLSRDEDHRMRCFGLSSSCFDMQWTFPNIDEEDI